MQQQQQQKQHHLEQRESSSQLLTDPSQMDYVHHIAFDVYGRRVATSAGDRYVRVWDLAADGTWFLSSKWQAHQQGAVGQLAWSHPEFGTLLATCAGPEVRIWEEKKTRHPQQSQQAVVWISKTQQLNDARKAVTCLGFAPRHLGLQLAAGSADGVCRVYEAVDLMNVSQWPLQGAFGGGGEGVTCLSWCTGRFEPATIVLGGHGFLSVWRYSSHQKAWQAYLQLDSAGQGGPPPHMLDVAWAPNVGRRFHLVAAAQSGGPLKVYRLSRHLPGSPGAEEKDGEWPDVDVKSYDLASSEQIWRCQWNVTGTVLAGSGDGGLVRLWKCNNGGEWRCVSEIYGDLSATQPPTAAATAMKM